MSTTAIAATVAYRGCVAIAAATGGAVPRASHIAFGTGDRPYSVDDTDTDGEFARLPATATTSGVLLTVKAVLPGSTVGERTLRNVAVFASDGTLMGRKVISPKQFEPETQMEFELHFQY